jgi:hypothetical protein
LSNIPRFLEPVAFTTQALFTKDGMFKRGLKHIPLTPFAVAKIFPDWLTASVDICQQSFAKTFSYPYSLYVNIREPLKNEYMENPETGPLSYSVDPNALSFLLNITPTKVDGRDGIHDEETKMGKSAKNNKDKNSNDLIQMDSSFYQHVRRFMRGPLERHAPTKNAMFSPGELAEAPFITSKHELNVLYPYPRFRKMLERNKEWGSSQTGIATGNVLVSPGADVDELLEMNGWMDKLLPESIQTVGNVW